MNLLPLNFSAPVSLFFLFFLSLPVMFPPGTLRADETLAPVMVLTSPAGKSIRAELISVDPEEGKVQYRRIRDGRVFNSRVSIFDGETQARLKSAAGKSSAEKMQPLRLTVKATSKEEKKPQDVSGDAAQVSDQAFYRTVVAMENRSAVPVSAVEIDIVVVMGANGETEEVIEERQSYPIRRIKGAGEILVQTRLYEVGAENDVKGVAIRLREADSGKVVFTWKSMSLNRHAVTWETKETHTGALAKR